MSTPPLLPPLAAMLKQGRRSLWIYPSRFIMLFVIAAMFWTWWARIDEVAVATGHVAPQGKTKIIQHLEGGIIREILFREGDTVKKGDVLLKLELGVQRLNVNELQVELDGLLLEREPWAAEIEDRSPTFSNALKTRRPEDVKRELVSYNARQDEIKSTLNVLSKQIRQRELAISTLRTKQSARGNDLVLARENLMLIENAISSGAKSRSELLPPKRAVEQLIGAIDTLEAEIQKAIADLAESKSRVGEAQTKFVNIATNKLGDIDRQIANIKQYMKSALVQGERTSITAPIDGIIKKAQFNTLGGVVRPGEPIMEIVPIKGDLVIQARLKPEDIGYVKIGQSANIKISTYDFTRYGTLEGEITLIGADADKDENGLPFFQMIVKTKHLYLGTSENPLPVSAGMQAIVDIKTGNRTVFEYFMRPVLKLGKDAFRER